MARVLGLDLGFALSLPQQDVTTSTLVGLVGRNAVEGKDATFADLRLPSVETPDRKTPLEARQTLNHRSHNNQQRHVLHRSVTPTGVAKRRIESERTEERVVRVTVVHVEITRQGRCEAPFGAEAAKENPCAPASRIRRGKVGGSTSSVTGRRPAEVRLLRENVAGVSGGMWLCSARKVTKCGHGINITTGGSGPPRL